MEKYFRIPVCQDMSNPELKLAAQLLLLPSGDALIELYSLPLTQFYHKHFLFSIKNDKISSSLQAKFLEQR